MTRRRHAAAPPGPWLSQGTCAQLGPLVWDQPDEAEQLGACHRCPVLDDCRRWASQHAWSVVVVAAWVAPPRFPRRPPDTP